MSKIYKGDVGTEIRLDCNPDDLAEVDISTANTLKILVQKPSGLEVEWIASRYGATNSITYTTTEGDLDEAGKYRFQAFIGWDSPKSEHRGETATLRVYEEWK